MIDIDHNLAQHFLTSPEELYVENSVAEEVNVVVIDGARYLQVSLENGNNKFIEIEKESFDTLRQNGGMLSRMKDFLNSYLIYTPLDAIKEAFESGQQCFHKVIEALGHPTTTEKVEAKIEAAVEIVANSKMVLAGAQQQDESKNEDKIVAEALEAAGIKKVPQVDEDQKKTNLVVKKTTVRRIIRRRKKNLEPLPDERGALLMARTKEIINEARSLLSRTISVCDAFEKEIFIICSCSHTSFTELWDTQESSICNSLENVKEMGKQVKELLQKARNARLEANDYANAFMLIGAASEALIASQIMLCSKFAILYFPPDSDKSPNEVKGYLEYITLEKDAYAEVWEVFLVARLCDKNNWSTAKKEAIKKVALMQLDSKGLLKFTQLFSALEEAEKRAIAANEPKILETYLSATLTGKNESFWGDAWAFLKNTSQKIGTWLGFRQEISEKEHAMTTSNLQLLEKNIKEENEKNIKVALIEEQVNDKVASHEATSLDDIEKKAILAEESEKSILITAKKNAEEKISNENITKAGEAMLQASVSAKASEISKPYLEDLLNSKSITPEEGRDIYEKCVKKSQNISSQFEVEFKPVKVVSKLQKSGERVTRINTSSLACKKLYNTVVSRMTNLIKTSISKSSSEAVDRIIQGQLSLSSQIKDFESSVMRKIDELIQNSETLKAGSSSFRDRIEQLEYQKTIKETVENDSYRKITECLEQNIDTQEYVERIDENIRKHLLDQKANYDVLVKGIAEIKAGIDHGAKIISTSSPKFLSEISFNAYAVATNETLGNLRQIANTNTENILQHFNANAKLIAQSVHEIRSSNKAEHQSILESLTFLTGTMQAQMNRYHEQFTKQLNEEFENMVRQNSIANQQQNQQMIQQMQATFQQRYDEVRNSFRTDILESFNENLKKECGQILALVGQCFAEVKIYGEKMETNFTHLRTFIEQGLKEQTNQTAILYNQIQSHFIENIQTAREGARELFYQSKKIEEAVAQTNFQQSMQNQLLSEQNKALNQGIEEIQKALKNKETGLFEENLNLRKELSFVKSNVELMENEVKRLNKIANEYKRIQEDYKDLQKTTTIEDNELRFLFIAMRKLNKQFEIEPRLTTITDITHALEKYDKILTERGFQESYYEAYTTTTEETKELKKKVETFKKRYEEARMRVVEAEKNTKEAEETVLSLRKTLENNKFDTNAVADRARLYDIMIGEIKMMRQNINKFKSTSSLTPLHINQESTEFGEIMSWITSELERERSQRISFQKEAARYESELKESKYEIDEKIKKNSKKERELQNTVTELKVELGEYKEKQAKLNGEINVLQQAKKFQGDNEEKYRRVAEELRIAEAKLVEVTTRESEANTKYIKAGQELSKVRIQSTSLEVELNEKKAIIEELHRQKEGLNKRLEVMTTKTNEKQKNSDKIKNTVGGIQYDTAEEMLIAKDKAYEVLRAEYANYLVRFETLEKEHNSLKSESSNKTNQIESLKDKLAKIDLAKAVINTEKAESEKKIRELSRQLAENKMELEQQIEGAKRVVLENNKIQLDIGQKETEIRGLKKEIKQKEGDYEELEDELESEKNKVIKLKKALETLEKQAKEYEEKIEAFKEVEKQLKEALIKLKETEAKLLEEETKYNELKKESNTSNNEHKFLIKEIESIVYRVNPAKLRTELFKNKFTETALREEEDNNKRLKIRLEFLTDQIVSLDRDSTDWNEYLKELREILGINESSIKLPDNKIAEIAIEIVKNHIQESNKKLKLLQKDYAEQKRTIEEMKETLEKTESELNTLKLRNVQEVERYKRELKENEDRNNLTSIMLTKAQEELASNKLDLERERRTAMEKEIEFQKQLTIFEKFQKQKKILLEALAIAEGEDIVAAMEAILKVSGLEVPERGVGVEDEAWLLTLVEILRRKRPISRDNDEEERKPSKRIDNGTMEKNNVTVNISLNTEPASAPPPPPPNPPPIPPPDLPMTNQEFAKEAKQILEVSPLNDIEQMTKDLNSAKKMLSEYEHIFIVIMTKLIKLFKKIEEYISKVENIPIKTAEQKYAVDLFIKFMGNLAKWVKPVFESVSFTDFINDYGTVKTNLKMFCDAFSSSSYIASHQAQDINTLIIELNKLIINV